jgi:hypothetical protein
MNRAGSVSPNRNSPTLLLTVTALAGSLACSDSTTLSGVEPVDVAEVRRVTSVVVSPGEIALDSGGTWRLVASAFDARGRVLSHVGIRWTSLDSAVATVSGGGLVTAARSGTARVLATVNGRADTAVVTVSAPGTVPAPSPTPAPAPTPAPPTNVIFSDDFESGTLSKWQDGVNPDKHRVINNASRAAGGSHYLEITYPSGGNGGWLTRFFMPGYDSLYVSYDVQFEATWTGGTKLLNLRGSRTDNQWSSFGQASKCPDGSQWFATNVVMLANENPGPIRFYTYFPGMQPESDGATCWGRHSGMGVTNYTGTSAIARGVWHRVEVFVKLNTPGQSNGVQRMWVNGELRGEWSGLVLRTTNMLMLNSLTLEGSLMGSAQSTTRRLLVDNVVVTPWRP